MSARAQRLVEPVAPIVTPQCEVIRQTPYANDTTNTDMRCKWASRYKIDGRHLCSKHAGPAALEILLESEKEQAHD